MENNISIVTRKDLLLSKLTLDKFEEILSVVLNFKERPIIEDSRYKNLYDEWHQHRIRNPEDRENERFVFWDPLSLLNMTDEEFLEILCKIIHPQYIEDISEINKVVNWVNDKLWRDWYEIFEVWKISWKPIFEWREMSFINASNIIFYQKNHWFIKNIETEDNLQFPCIILESDSWNDFWYRTTFSVFFCLNSESIERIGRTKILQDWKTTTEVPESFKQLSDEYCSLFQTEEAYRKLNSRNIKNYKIAIWLNDITKKPDLYTKYKATSCFQKSLIRENEAALIVEEHIEKKSNDDMSFNFIQSNPHKYSINFNFQKNSILPYRINILIWKNGAGKTTNLSKIAQWLVNPLEHKEYFNETPRFKKIITISYSIFDNFDIPKAREIWYQYCWFKNIKKTSNIENALEERLDKALTIINEKQQNNLWNYFLKEMLEEDYNFENIKSEYKKLSSWQRILITAFSQILAHIEEKSLILFDEPETHLHPNIVFKLIKTMYRILNDYDSYLIIGTHSPIVIQQVPWKYINILSREEDMVSVRKLERNESFWENFSTITTEIFGDYNTTDALYKYLFNELYTKYNETDILDAFNNKLSLNARIYLKSLYTTQERWEQ
jgi:predicted ATPase